MLPLQDLVAHLLPASIAALGWSPRVFCTENFRSTVASLGAGAALN